MYGNVFDGIMVLSVVIDVVECGDVGVSVVVDDICICGDIGGEDGGDGGGRDERGHVVCD